MTEEIKHINKKNQEYIAEGNRMTKEIIIDESNATEFNYTLKSIDKVIGCKFVKESYTPKEICELLKQFCMVLDLKILEAKGE